MASVDLSVIIPQVNRIVPYFLLLYQVLDTNSIVRA
jgi:hypothetical protein